MLAAVEVLVVFASGGPMRVPVSLFVAAAAVSVLPGQRTWVVDRANGPGTDFLDLPPAVAAAAPGDTLVIVGQACSPFPGLYTAPMIDKGLRLVGTQTAINVDGQLVIANVPASQSVILQNVSLSGSTQDFSSFGLIVQACAGQVVLDGCRIHYGFPANSVVRFEDCARLTITRGDFQLDTAAVFERCNVRISGSHFRCGGKYAPERPTAACTSLVARDSEVTVLDSRIEGATQRFYFVYYYECRSDPSAPGIRVERCVLRMGRAARAEGNMLVGSSHWLCGYSSGGCATEGSIEARDSTVILDPRSSQQCPVLGVVQDVHSVEASSAWQGLRADATVATSPGALVALGAGYPMQLPIVTSVGLWHLDPAVTTIVGVAPASSHGVSSFRFTADLPTGTIIALQALVLLPNCSLQASIPMALAIVDLPTAS